MFEVVRLDSGSIIGYRFWRLFVYARIPSYASLNYGGCMVNYFGKREVARHVFWQFCWVTPRKPAPGPASEAGKG